MIVLLVRSDGTLGTMSLLDWTPPLPQSVFQPIWRQFDASIAPSPDFVTPYAREFQLQLTLFDDEPVFVEVGAPWEVQWYACDYYPGRPGALYGALQEMQRYRKTHLVKTILDRRYTTERIFDGRCSRIEELGLSPTLGDAFPKEQARLRVCLRHGQEIGPAGAFYCAVIEDLLARADKAAMEQDLVQMIVIYKEMREIKE